jgi:hypothetical protein
MDYLEEYNKFMEHPLHSHPLIEAKLGLPDEYVIVEKEPWWEMMKTQLSRPAQAEHIPWWVLSSN